MRAIIANKFGSFNVLKYKKTPIPEPGDGQILVKVKYAGVNFADIYHRRGWYKRNLPFIPGAEAGGEVVKIGNGVKEFKNGDVVVCFTETGSYAEYALAPGWQAVKKPKGIELKKAVALVAQGLTAHFLSHDTFPLKKGDTALILAAAGGVGRLLVQMAKMRGAKVIALVSTKEKSRLAKKAGASHVILYNGTDFSKKVRQLTKGNGVDVVYDSVGKTTFEKSLDSLRPRGLLVLFGQASGPVAPFDPQILNQKGSLYLTRPSGKDYLFVKQKFLSKMNDLFLWAKNKKIDVIVDKIFPLEKAAKAHKYLEDRKTMGKVLLKV